MNKKHIIIPTVFLLALSLFAPLANQVGNVEVEANPEVVKVIPPYEPITPPEKPKNIESIEILGIPEDKRIAIGYFDAENIRYVLRYDDGSSSEPVQIKNADLPLKAQEALGQPGVHKFTIQIRDKKASFELEMVDSGLRFIVNFIDYESTILDSVYVMPNNHVKYSGKTPTRSSDIYYKYTFTGWSPDVLAEDYIVTGNVDTYAVYERTLKNNDYVACYDAPLYNTHRESKIEQYNNTEYDVDAAYYGGRMSNVIISRGEDIYRIEHQKGSSDVMEYYFFEDDSPLVYDASDFDKRHPLLTDTMMNAIRSVYTYDATGVDDNIISQSSRQFINPIFLDHDGITLKSQFVHDVNNNSYKTSINKSSEYIAPFFSDVAQTGHINIPSDYASGTYIPVVYCDFDIYIYAKMTKTIFASGNISYYTTIFALFAPIDIYIGFAFDEEHSSETSTAEDHKMNLSLKSLQDQTKELVDNIE